MRYDFVCVITMVLLNTDACSAGRILVRKCCAIGTTWMNASCTEDATNVTDSLGDEYEMNFTRFGKLKCAHGKNMFLLDSDEFRVRSDGLVEWMFYKFSFGYADYCVDLVDGKLGALTCQSPPADSSTAFVVGMIISMPFLVITFLVYALMPEKNLPAKYLMCYVFSLFCAYLFLIIIQLNTSIPTLGCISLSAICIYAFMSSFCWLSVSSVDIFLTFSGIRGYGGTKKAIDRRRFLIYFSFAYGLPLIHITIILLLTNLLDPNLIGTWYHPNLGKRTCWLGDGWPNLTYFYAPMGAILVLNIVMFTITALKIRQINKDTAMLHKDKDNKKHFDKNHQIFKLYLKLMFALGINWSMEFISFLCDFLLDKKKIPEIWYLTDFCNAVYGVVIFFVFVWKPATWIMLKKRYYNFMGKHHLARAMSTTPHTQSSNYQMSHTEMTSMDERPNTQSY